MGCRPRTTKTPRMAAAKVSRTAGIALQGASAFGCEVVDVLSVMSAHRSTATFRLLTTRTRSPGRMAGRKPYPIRRDSVRSAPDGYLADPGASQPPRATTKIISDWQAEPDATPPPKPGKYATRPARLPPDASTISPPAPLVKPLDKGHHDRRPAYRRRSVGRRDEGEGRGG